MTGTKRFYMAVISDDGKNVIDELTVLTDEEIDRVVPADVRRITIKDYSYDEYWTWEIHEKVIG